MDGNTHRYECQVTWDGDRRGRALSTGRAEIPIGAPPEFGGTDDVWSPELLTAASVNACIMLTFVTIAGNSKVPISGYVSDACATLEKVEGRGMVVTRVTVHPRVTVPPGVELAKVERLFAMAKRNCFVSNSLTGTVTVEPEVVTNTD